MTQLLQIFDVDFGQQKRRLAEEPAAFFNRLSA